MGLKELIKETPEDRFEVVEHSSGTYVLKGRSSLNMLVDSIMTDPKNADLLAKHWTKLVGEDFKSASVKHVLAVKEVLMMTPDDYQQFLDMSRVDPLPTLNYYYSDGKTASYIDQLYDQDEVARLACIQSALFLKLVAATYKVLGLAQDMQAIANGAPGTLEQAIAGNSEASAESTSS